LVVLSPAALGRNPAGRKGRYGVSRITFSNAMSRRRIRSFSGRVVPKQRELRRVIPQLVLHARLPMLDVNLRYAPREAHRRQRSPRMGGQRLIERNSVIE
jgi:hypothetical protein